MTKFLLIFFLCYSLNSVCTAQKLTPGLLKINNKRFKVSQSRLKNPVNEKIILTNMDYKYAEVSPKVKNLSAFPMQKKDIHFDIAKVKELIYHIVSNKLSILKSKKETLALQFIFDQNGNLKDIGYILFRKTALDLKDINEIDANLKQKIKASYSGTDYLQYEEINYSYPTIVF